METTKKVKCFRWARQGRRFFPFVLLLDFYHIVKVNGDIIFSIYVCHYDINDGICLVLPQMADLNTPPRNAV